MQFLKRKIGPVPVWALVVLLGAVVAWWWYRNKQSGGPGDTSYGETPLVVAATPQQAASAGAPASNAAPATQMSPDVLNELSGFETSTTTAFNEVGTGIEGVNTRLDVQANQLDALTALVTQTALEAKPAPGGMQTTAPNFTFGTVRKVASKHAVKPTMPKGRAKQPVRKTDAKAKPKNAKKK